MSYLKRYAAPRSWQLLRKENTYVMRPAAGPHPRDKSLPLGLILKQLGHATTTKEAKKIMNNTELLVDGRRIKDHKFPVGLMDTISLSGVDEHYRVLIDKKGRLILTKIDKKQAGTKPARVLGKTLLPGGKMQLNLADGRNALIDKADIKVGDSVVIDLPAQKVSGNLKLENGAKILLTAGRHAGSVGIVSDIARNLIRFTSNDESFETLKTYAFVIPEGIVPQ